MSSKNKLYDKFREPENIFPASLTATEQDIFALLLCEISKVKGKREKFKKLGKELPLIPHVFNFSEADLMHAFNCKKDNIRKILEPAAVSLRSRPVGYSGEKGFDNFSPIARVKYDVGGDFVIYMLPDVVEMLCDYNGFSEIDFRLFTSFSGRYEKRILKEISRWKGLDKRIIFSISEYKERLGVKEGSYSIFANFKKRCIDEPIKKIISESYGVWTPSDKDGLGYKLIKKGRSYSEIEICLKYNPESKLAVDKFGQSAISAEPDDLSLERNIFSSYENKILSGTASELDCLIYETIAMKNGFIIPVRIKAGIEKIRKGVQ